MKDWHGLAFAMAAIAGSIGIMCIPGQPRTHVITCNDSVCRPGFKVARCSCGENETMELMANGDVYCRCKSKTYEVQW